MAESHSRACPNGHQVTTTATASFCETCGAPLVPDPIDTSYRSAPPPSGPTLSPAAPQSTPTSSKLPWLLTGLVAVVVVLAVALVAALHGDHSSSSVSQLSPAPAPTSHPTPEPVRSTSPSASPSPTVRSSGSPQAALTPAEQQLIAQLQKTVCLPNEHLDDDITTIVPNAYGAVRVFDCNPSPGNYSTAAEGIVYIWKDPSGFGQQTPDSEALGKFLNSCSKSGANFGPGEGDANTQDDPTWAVVNVTSKRTIQRLQSTASWPYCGTS